MPWVLVDERDGEFAHPNAQRSPSADCYTRFEYEAATFASSQDASVFKEYKMPNPCHIQPTYVDDEEWDVRCVLSAL